MLIAQEQQAVHDLVGGDDDAHFPAELVIRGAGLLLQYVYYFFESVVHNFPVNNVETSEPLNVQPSESLERCDQALTSSTSFSPFTFSNKVMTPWISASGRGGQPATYTSTGTTSSTPCTTA